MSGELAGHIFVVQGDITQISAHALAYSASTYLGPDGHLYPAFAANVAGFAEQYAAQPSPCRQGETFWLPLSASRKPHGVVVVAATGGGRSATREQKVKFAVKNALERAIAELRAILPKSERLLIALPTFRQGLGGDRHVRLEQAQLQMETVHRVLQAHPGVDAVFVTYTADSYQIFLQARHDKTLEPACPLKGRSYLELLNALRGGRCVLFVGAGLSAGAGLPGWGQLMERLAHKLGISFKRGDLDGYLDLAQWFVEQHGHDDLSQLIREEIGNIPVQPTLAHYYLMSLPVRLVITTNYDNLLERTLTALRKHPVTVVDEKDVVRTSQADGVCVVKFHGDVRQGTGFILSRDDYDAFFRERPAMALMLEGLLLNQTFLFAGYGLKDPNFRQIYSRIASMLKDAKREAFALTVDAATESGPFLTKQWQKKGLHLLAMPGDSDEERIQVSLRFLDWLADRVTLSAPGLFLAHDVPASAALQLLRQHLVDGVGRALEEICDVGWSAGDTPHLVKTLDFLTSNGWRPSSGQPLYNLWARLAEQVKDVEEKRKLLITALRLTERFDDASEIRNLLEELEKNERGSEPSGAVPP